MDAELNLKLKRKPLAASVPPKEPSAHLPAATEDLPLPYSNSDLESQLENFCLAEKASDPEDYEEPLRPPLPPRPVASPIVASPAALTPTSPAGFPFPSPPTARSEKSFLQTAFSETRHFASGLLPHPTVSTKHYTILRHSPALVPYRGPATSVCVSVFSSPDRPLPLDRTLWLQRRGFSGDAGMRVRTLVGATATWLDVTPSTRVAPEDATRADPDTERARERDIARFERKARARCGSERAHVARETVVVRVPGVAADGYFRLVLCISGGEMPASGPVSTAGGVGVGGGGGGGGEIVKAGKRKVLCASPVFRVASTSTDASVLRGASLSTLPLELGVKIGSMIGSHTVGNLVSPLVSPIQAQVQKYQPGFLAKEAGLMAYDQFGAERRVDAMDDRYRQARESSYDVLQPGEVGALDFGGDEAPPEVIGPEDGPRKPFPLTFQGKVVKGMGRATAELGIPTANMADVTEDVKLRLKGVYFGWACVIPRKELEGISHDWHEAVIGVGPSPYAAPKVVVKNVVTVHMLHDFAGKTFFDAKVKAIVMGFLRPLKPAECGFKELVEAVSRDVVLTIASLSRENWGPVMTLGRSEAEKSSRSFAERYVDARQSVQRQVDRIPFHWAGVRTPGAELRDRAHGTGGYWIPRCEGSVE